LDQVRQRPARRDQTDGVNLTMPGEPVHRPRARSPDQAPAMIASGGAESLVIQHPIIGSEHSIELVRASIRNAGLGPGVHPERRRGSRVDFRVKPGGPAIHPQRWT
jgi:hypothetical protein